MNTLTKHLRLATFLWVALVFSPQAMADYISLKEGAFQSLQFSDALNDIIYYKDRNGRLREVEFNWGSKKALQAIGGVQVDSNNKVTNFFMGLVFDKKDQFIYRELHIQDRLFYRADYSLDTGYAVGKPDYLLSNVDAKMREITYVFSGGKVFIKVGESNLPVGVSTVSPSTGYTETFVDINPKTTFLIVGAFNPMDVEDSLHRPLKELIRSGARGFTDYFDHRFDFGFMTQQLSQQIYSSNYGNTLNGTRQVDAVGVRGIKGSDIVVTAALDFGVAYISKFGENTAVASVGVFSESTAPLSSFFTANSSNAPSKTGNGTGWHLGSYILYGIYARVGMDF